MRILPALFNTVMVRAIFDGRKTVTRRVVKLKYSNTHLEMRTDKYGTRLIELQNEEPGVTTIKNPDGTTTHTLLAAREVHAPYRRGDVLYVRETWCWCPCWDCGHDSDAGCTEMPSSRFYNADRQEYGCYGYKASFANGEQPFDRWRPSIHMPREAARIFLRVTDVRAERLCSIDVKGMLLEGLNVSLYGEDVEQWREDILTDFSISNSGRGDITRWVGYNLAAWKDFEMLWNSTIKPAAREKNGWAANPWVWVICFERCEKPDEFGH